MDIAVYGAGGFGREVSWLIQSCNKKYEIYRVVAFIDDDEAKYGKTINHLPVMGLDECLGKYSDIRIVRGTGDIRISEAIVKRVESKNINFQSIVHPGVEYSKWVKIGNGSVICAGCILTTNITLGKHVQINLNCTLGHDVVVGDYTTFAPGVRISGYVNIGKKVYIGTGAVVLNGTEGNPLLIGDDAVIGASACVTKSIPSGQTWGGVPAKKLYNTPLS